MFFSTNPPRLAQVRLNVNFSLKSTARFQPARRAIRLYHSPATLTRKHTTREPQQRLDNEPILRALYSHSWL
jgi:hypothetical protein